tara:strand:+ start:715 stop:1065 length:351 start_codon:yes stop_codon:yes gene_type:complete
MEEKKKRGRPSKDDDNSAYLIIKDKLMEPYYIQKDHYNFTVIEKVTPTKGFAGKEAKGKELERPIGYYTSFRNALNKISKEKFQTHTGDYNSIKEYIDEWDIVKNGIDSLLNTIQI